jgi:hypothetical protein
MAVVVVGTIVVETYVVVWLLVAVITDVKGLAVDEMLYCFVVWLLTVTAGDTTVVEVTLDCLVVVRMPATVDVGGTTVVEILTCPCVV